MRSPRLEPSPTTQSKTTLVTGATVLPSGLASDWKLPYAEIVFGLNYGEWFIVAFVTVMVVSARYWPALGERIAVRLGGADAPPRE